MMPNCTETSFRTEPILLCAVALILKNNHYAHKIRLKTDAFFFRAGENIMPKVRTVFA